MTGREGGEEEEEGGGRGGSSGGGVTEARSEQRSLINEH